MSSSDRPQWAEPLDATDYELASRGLFTVAAASAYAALSEGSIRKAIRCGELPARKLGRGYRIWKADLDAFLGFGAA